MLIKKIFIHQKPIPILVEIELYFRCYKKFVLTIVVVHVIFRINFNHDDERREIIAIKNKRLQMYLFTDEASKYFYLLQKQVSPKKVFKNKQSIDMWFLLWNMKNKKQRLVIYHVVSYLTKTSPIEHQFYLVIKKL